MSLLLSTAPEELSHRQRAIRVHKAGVRIRNGYDLPEGLDVEGDEALARIMLRTARRLEVIGN